MKKYNCMSATDSLLQKFEQLSAEHSEQCLVLNSMREGVLSIDADERITYSNDATYTLLGPGANRPRVNAENVYPRILEETIRNAALQRFIKRALLSAAIEEEEVVVDFEDSERFLQAYATPLSKEGEASRGVVVVLTDVTHVHHLENVRRDFVANVSHELKTPITSIKGFVETLLDGAIDNPQDARRFLGIIARQADRLNAIFEDLLSLSRIEQEKERNGIKLEVGEVCSVIEAALQSCEFSASERGIVLESHCENNLQANFHAALLEQAIVNLVDNAIKFSEEGQKVKIEARHQGPEVLIEIIDNGKGIDKSQLGRIFERFYRVEKSRSRLQGGTGLGLAIVKHIAQAHGGFASVESELGKGSVFTLHLDFVEPVVESTP